MANPSCIWLTRPSDDSEALAAQLTHLGIDSIVAPVMRIEHRTPPAVLPPQPDALLLTSRHAVAMVSALPEAWRALPVFCVGAATGAMVHAAGFKNIIQGETDIIDLLPSLAETLPAEARVLYLAGAETRVDVTALLAVKGIRVETLIAYDALAETELSRECVAALQNGRLTGVVFFSPRSVQLAQVLLGSHSVAHVEAFCLSLAVAEGAGVLAWRSIHACHTPTVEAMLHLIVSRSTAKVV